MMYLYCWSVLGTAHVFKIIFIILDILILHIYSVMKE